MHFKNESNTDESKRDSVNSPKGIYITIVNHISLQLKFSLRLLWSNHQTKWLVDPKGEPWPY